MNEPAGANRRCPQCGYDLRATPRGGRCPECGHTAVATVYDDTPLIELPMVVVRRFRGASLFAAVVIVLIVLLMGLRSSWTHGRQTWWGLQMVVAIGWVVATFRLTPAFDLPAAVGRGFGRRGRLRVIARIGALGWVAATAVGLVGVTLPRAIVTKAKLAPWLMGGRIAGIAVGLIGVFALGIILMRLAEWVRDKQAELGFQIALWGVPPSVILLLMVGRMPIIALVVFGLVSMAVLSFPIALLSLSKSLAWSVRHAEEFRARRARQLARRESYQEEVAASVARMDASRGDGA
ncbi:MAG: hypothetical protein HKO59_01680 [Phycisphaerales bacterium]|nr:hypothetical protein [Phycisphaerales bacterium]